LVPLACASSPTAKPGDGGPDAPTDRGPDGGGDDVPAAPDAPADVPGAEVTPFGVPLPSDVAPPLRLLDAPSELTGAGRSSCSHQEPASGNGDRWCSFRRPHAGGGTELWVINASAAARGQVPVCDGTDAGCLRLSTTLWASYGNDFEGDTLVFYSDAPAGLLASQAFVGPVSAWRPGWKAPHVIAPAATVCSAHRVAAVALCFDEPRGNSNNPDDVRLRAGVLADAAGVLPSLPGRWPLRTDGSIPWQLAFSPDGQTLAVSVPDAVPFVQNLSVIAVKDVGTGDLTRNVLTDVKPWTISNDGKKIYFYRGEKSDATLAMADFPTGAGETILATKVVDFIPLGRTPADAALFLHVRTDAEHVFRILHDRASPEKAVTVFTNEGFLEGVAIARDLRYAAWIDGSFRGKVIRVSDLAACEMNPDPAPPVSDVGFLEDSSYVFWSQPDMTHQRRDGYLAPPDRCSERTRFASGVNFVSVIGARGIIYGDGYDESDRTVTLKYASLASGTAQAAAGGVRVAERVAAPVTLVSGATAAGSLHVVYGAQASGGKAAGVFMFGPVPF
jgi:hypothetical protein